MRVLSMAGSSSKNSINYQWAKHIGSLLSPSIHTAWDWSSLEIPLFSQNIEHEIPTPEGVKQFIDLLESHDILVLSLAEHNGSYAAAFKNLIDWTSRKKKSMWSGIPMVLLSTSQGKRGGATVLQHAAGYFPFMGADIITSYALPLYGQTFSPEQGIMDSDVQLTISKIVETVQARVQ